MGTTLDRAKVGCLDLTEVAQLLTESQMKTRDGLPRERNGKTKAPSCPAAAQIRKEMASRRSSEFARLLTVVYTDLEDGVPFEIASAPIRRLLMFLQIHADAICRERKRPLARAIREESKAEYSLNSVEWLLMEFAHHPEAICTDVLETAIEKATAHIAALSALSRACHEELVTRGMGQPGTAALRVAR